MNTVQPYAKPKQPQVSSHLLSNISRLSLEVFEGLDHGVVVQDGALHGTDGVQKALLQLTELPREDITNKTTRVQH